MKRRFSLLVMLVAAVFLGTVIGCGGGGGSGDSINYTGNNQPSVIDTATAVDMTRDLASEIESVSGESFMDTGFLPLGMQQSEALSRFLDPEQVMGNLLEMFDEEPSPVLLDLGVIRLAYQCRSLSDSGDFSGNAYGRVCGDFDGETFTYIDYIQANFKDYSEDGESFLDGAMTLDMRSSVMRLSFQNFSYYDPWEDFFLSGTMSFTESGGSSTVDINLFLYDNILEDGFWLNNVVIVQEAFVDYIEVSFSGRFFDFFEGFVDVETIEDLVIEDGSEYPSSGTFKIIGADGASITVEIDETGFVVYVDLDGDGETDWTSAHQAWEEG